uniref:fish-egg lectin-like n=1 Tax=Doryrhamphus excisus TaxID=161450 RepID=UPI0025ADA71A|nr:fish-egg lectin-like [Doryrhamphus excisus]
MKAVIAFLLVLCHLGATGAWSCQEAPRLYYTRQIEASQGKVLARTSSNRVYFLSGKSWYRLGSVSLKDVSVGPAGIWGVDSSNRVHKFIAGEFLPSTGALLQQVDAGGNGQVVGLTPTNYTHCLRSTYAAPYKGVGSLSWSSMGRVMKDYSCGPRFGCWGVDQSNRVYVSQVSPTTCGSSSWTLVTGFTMSMIDVSTDGSVFGVTTNGLVYQRTGISSHRPQGTSWVSVPMCMAVSSLSYDLGQLWVLTNSGLLLQCSH